MSTPKTLVLNYSWNMSAAIFVMLALVIVLVARRSAWRKTLGVLLAIPLAWAAVYCMTWSARVSDMGIIVWAPADPFEHSGNVAWFEVKSVDVSMGYSQNGPSYFLDIAGEEGKPFKINVTDLSDQDAASLAGYVAAHLPKNLASVGSALPGEIADARAAHGGLATMTISLAEPAEPTSDDTAPGIQKPPVKSPSVPMSTKPPSAK